MQRALASFERSPDIIYASYPFKIGSGKTITSLATAEALKLSGRIDALIIVSPKSVCATWEKQIGQHCDWPSRPFRWRGDKANTAKYKSAMLSSLVDPFPIFLVNIEAFQTKNALLFQTVKDFLERNKVLVILDEGATIKNHKAQRTKNVTELMRPAVGRIFLAGVLFSNTILDIFSPYEFLKQSFWREQSPYFFQKKYCVMIQRRVMDNKTIEVIAGPSDVREMLNKVDLAESAARRNGKPVPYWAQQMRFDAEELQRRLDRAKELEKEVYAQIDHCTHWVHVENKLLPPVRAEMIVEMSDREEEVYTDFKNDLMTILDTEEILSVTTKAALFQKARQITGGFIDELHPVDNQLPSKLKAILDEVSTVEDSAIITSNYRGIIKLATQELEKIAPTRALFGDTTQEQRDEAVRGFADGSVRFIVINPMVGARGIDSLQSNCRLMYHLDVHPNPEIMEQMEGRIMRTGQTGICVFKTLIAVTQSGKDTVDRRCVEMIQDKQDAITSFHNLSKKEMRNFF